MNHNVNITSGFQYMPENPDQPIVVGDTVTWINQSEHPHTATADNGSFDTGDIEPGASSDPIPFNQAGTFPYHCEIHSGMTSSLTIS